LENQKSKPQKSGDEKIEEGEESPKKRGRPRVPKAEKITTKIAKVSAEPISNNIEATTKEVIDSPVLEVEKPKEIVAEVEPKIGEKIIVGLDKPAYVKAPNPNQILGERKDNKWRNERNQNGTFGCQSNR
jgi:hypothetical protein